MIEAMQSKPPVRLSVEDEGFDADVGARLRVFLDGVSQDLKVRFVPRPRLFDLIVAYATALERRRKRDQAQGRLALPPVRIGEAGK
jgi:hypothetical protein